MSGPGRSEERGSSVIGVGVGPAAATGVRRHWRQAAPLHSSSDSWSSFWTGLWVLGLVVLAIVSAGLAEASPSEPVEPRVGPTSTDPQLTLAPASLALPPAPVEPELALPPAAREPARPAPSLYVLAGRAYGLDPRLLRALHLVESTAATEGCPANLEGSGALGPLQFMPSTFLIYGVDADGNGRAEICRFPDALFSAAHYLRELGADEQPASPATYKALRRYGTDPDRVLALLGTIAPD